MNNLREVDRLAEGDSFWWALYTRHQHEKVIAQILTTKGFEVFLPLYESIRRWKDRNKTLSLPLFPCYVFVRGGLSRRSLVVTTPGVHMILYNGERVAVIPDEEIEGIRRAVDGPFRVEPHPFLRCGERVRVTRGSLEGVEGVLVRKKSIYRLVLSVDMLAQSVAVEIDASDVEPASAHGKARAGAGLQLARVPYADELAVRGPRRGLANQPS
jgi:transcription antitermination factor NusG